MLDVRGDAGRAPLLPMSLRIAHFSDTHLGYEAYPALSVNGNNQRGEDIVRAMTAVVNDIIAWKPDIVIHSGDVLERPKTDIRYMLVAQQLFRKLADVCPTVVIAGNHELPRSRKEACWLDLLRGIDNLHIATTRYDVIHPAGMENVAVHAVPHDVLKDIDQSVIVPRDGHINILVSHGVATGSELFTRSLGREYAIEIDTLLRDWSYVALGHWHRQGPVHLGATGVAANVWYAGSTENMGFRDLRENSDSRGYLRVTLTDDPEAPCAVSPVSIPTRRMFRLPVVEGAGMEPATLAETLVERLKSGDIAGAVVGQVVTGVSRDLWSLVDVARVREEAQAALHYEITVRYDTDTQSPVEKPTGVDAFASALNAAVEHHVPEDFREPVMQKARHLLAAAGEGAAS